VYRYSGADLEQVVNVGQVEFVAGEASLELPSSSITLLVIPGMAQLGDFDGDGDVDVADLRYMQLCFGQLPEDACTPGDLDGDGGIDFSDVMLQFEHLLGPT
jgi:hypothetical protein